MGNNLNNVVVIDDSQTTLLIVENLLKELDKTIEVKLFDRPEFGLKHLKTQKTDLLILDLYMPKLNGIDVLKKISPANGMKVFMISAKTKVVEIESAIALGIDEYFTKPLKIEMLKTKISESFNFKKNIKSRREN